MKEKIKTFFCVLLLLVALPYIITMIFQGKAVQGDIEDENILEVSETEDTEAYLVGVVAGEIPMTYETEALKAQAVVARTNLMAARELQEELPQTLTEEELWDLWGEEHFAQNYERLQNAVKATRGETMTVGGKYIYAAYHAVSAGRTRNASDALETEEMPWLESVESTTDISGRDYLKVISWEKEELVQKVQTAFPEAVLDAGASLSGIIIESRDAAGYVMKMKVGELAMSGEEFRNGLELSSACFYLKEVEGKIRIVTKGLGHGLGLSQYGANALALEGMSYLEILSYYFKNVEISD